MAPMDTTPRIQVTPASPRLLPALQALRVLPTQRAFVGDPVFNVADAQRDPLSDAMAILAGDAVIGFYRLDRAPRTVLGRALEHPHLGLRTLLIDHAQQGCGLGTRAIRACCTDARLRFPRHCLLALGVGRDNHAARAAYRRAGFRDSGERQPGGADGPQHILTWQLRPLRRRAATTLETLHA